MIIITIFGINSTDLKKRIDEKMREKCLEEVVRVNVVLSTTELCRTTNRSAPYMEICTLTQQRKLYVEVLEVILELDKEEKLGLDIMKTTASDYIPANEISKCLEQEGE